MAKSFHTNTPKEPRGMAMANNKGFYVNRNIDGRIINSTATSITELPVNRVCVGSCDEPMPGEFDSIYGEAY